MNSFSLFIKFPFIHVAEIGLNAQHTKVLAGSYSSGSYCIGADCDVRFPSIFSNLGSIFKGLGKVLG